MRSNLTRLVAAAAAILTIGFGTSTGADDKAVFIQLPAGALANKISSSGVIVGGLRPVGGFHWMPTSGDVFIGGVSAVAVSADGRVIAGTALDANRNQQAAIWQRGTEWRLLGSVVPNATPCDSFISGTFGANRDGTVLVGLAWNGCSFARAFRWEESTGMVDLGSTVPNQSSRADAVSGDGRVVVGWQGHQTGFRQGARWVDGKQTIFTSPDGGLIGEANGTNTDGSIIVGQYCQPSTPFDQSAWMWTAGDGVQCLDVPRRRTAIEGTFGGLAIATSDDGRVIGGAHSFGLESESVLWIDRTPYYLKDYLRDHGVPNAFENWVNTGFITGMTRDGRVLVGYGAGPRDFTGFMVILPSLGEKP
jgi:probable HAF family extracellular repeat protein